MPDTAMILDDDTQDTVVEQMEEQPAPSGNTDDVGGEATDEQQTGEEQPESGQSPQFTEEQQRIFNDAINKKVAKQRAAEERAEQAEREAKEARERLEQLQAPTRPVIPELPDPFDDNYDQQIAAREEAIKAAAQYDADIHQQAIMAQREQERLQQEQMAEQQKVVSDYSARANKLGVKPDELQRAANVVSQYNVSDDVINHILQDEQGPSITVYLGNNPAEIDAIRQMTPAQAGAYIETKVKPNAVKSRPVPSPPPTPADTPKGSGMPESDGGPEGATYE